MKRVFLYLRSCNRSFTTKKDQFGAFIVGYVTCLVIRHYSPNFLLSLLFFFLALTAEMIIWCVLRKTFKRRFKKKVE